MVLDFHNINRNAISLPITSENRQIAAIFSAQQSTKQKEEQIYFNTLAVLIVNNYLSMLGVSTDLSHSDSWNPVMRACDNVADLEILGRGKLECRPVRNIDSSCHIPMEVWDLRLGYVIVKIDVDDYFKEATILGFLPQVSTAEVAISNLRPIEALIDHLHDLKELSLTNNNLVNLEHWLDNVFSSGWETIESLLNREQLTSAWRSRNRGFRNSEFISENFSQLGEIDPSIQRAKLIDLGIHLGDRQIILLVEITPEESGSIGVTLQIHPSLNGAYVPETLSLKVIESSGAVFMQAKARSRDDFIQLQFSGQPKERFTVQIVLNDVEFIEQFQL